MTPEAKVKVKVTKILKSFGDNLWYYMPVPFGYGATTLDYLCAVQVCPGHGQPDPISFAIETKAPGKDPTPRQDALIAQLRRMGMRVFVIDGTPNTDTYEDLETWLRSLQ